MFRKVVQLEPVAQDRYDRLVARVHQGELEVNAELVKLGYAWAARRYQRKEESDYCTFEAAAREARRGVWRLTPDPQIAP